jgi:hypothetical protein
MSLMCESFTKVSSAGGVEAPPVAPAFASHLVFVALCEAPIVGRCVAQFLVPLLYTIYVTKKN